MDKKSLIFNFQSISKYREILMGIAILEVLTAHMFLWLNAPAFLVIISSQLVFVFTQGFLILSGLGLYYSYTKNNDNLSFYLRRIKRVWLPYMIMALPFVITIALLRDDLTPLKTIGWITAIGYFYPGSFQYCNMWYIAMSLLCYALFPIMYHFMFGKHKNAIGRFFILFITYIIITILIYKYNYNYYSLVSVGLPKGCMFILGILIGYLCFKKVNINIIYLSGISFLLFLFFFYFRHYNSLITQYYCMAGKLFFIPVLCYLLTKINIEQTLIWKCLLWLGKYTLEIYVLHLMIKQLLYSLKFNMWIFTSISIILSLILAPIAHKYSTNITNKLIPIK